MQSKKFILLLLCLLNYLWVPAATVPAQMLASSFGDTTLAMPVTMAIGSSPSEKKPAFFHKFKNKLLGFALKRSVIKEDSNNSKHVLSYIGLALLVLAFPLGIILQSAAVFFALVTAGTLAGAVSVLSPGSNKRKVLGEIVAVVGGIVLLFSIIIALAARNKRFFG